MTREIFIYDPLQGAQLDVAMTLYSNAVRAGIEADVTSELVSRFVGTLLDYFPVFDERRSAVFRDLLVPPFEMYRLMDSILIALPDDAHEYPTLIGRIANEMGLVVYDPQAGEVDLPLPRLDASDLWSPGLPNCGDF